MSLREQYVDLIWEKQALLISDPPFTLKSNRQSYVYANHRNLICLPSAAAIMIDALLEEIVGHFGLGEFAVATVDSTVSPFLGAMCALRGIPLYVTRIVSREKGVDSNLFSYDNVESPGFAAHLPAVIVDDVLTTMATVGSAAELLRSHDREVLGVGCLLDRRIAEDVPKSDLAVFPVATLEQVLDHVISTGQLPDASRRLIRDELLEVRRQT